MLLLAPLKFLFTISILSIYVEAVQLKDATATSLSLSCPLDQFACEDGSKCIPNSDLCNSYQDCDDASDQSASLCLSPCSTDLFACAHGFRCISDESASLCSPPCSTDMFACEDGLKCISKSYLCDNNDDCEDKSDESASICTPPCSSDLFACADGSKCIQKSMGTELVMTDQTTFPPSVTTALLTIC